MPQRFEQDRRSRLGRAPEPGIVNVCQVVSIGADHQLSRLAPSDTTARSSGPLAESRLQPHPGIAARAAPGSTDRTPPSIERVAGEEDLVGLAVAVSHEI